eukprot:6530380-Alexandrium_andersonii.AAC.1
MKPAPEALGRRGGSRGAIRIKARANHHGLIRARPALQRNAPGGPVLGGVGHGGGLIGAIRLTPPRSPAPPLGAKGLLA